MKNIEGGTFLMEASRRVPEKIIKSAVEGAIFAEQNKKSKSFLLDLSRKLNPEFQLGVDEVPPILIYGTVDPVGNVSELLTMMDMSRKIGVPTAIILDDVCHDLKSCASRIMMPSFDLVGMKGSRMDQKIGFNSVNAIDVLPNKLIDCLIGFGFSPNGTLADAYEASLYLIANEFFGDKALTELVLLRTSEIFSTDSMLGKIPLSFLREKVNVVAERMRKDRLVFLHVDGEKNFSDNSFFDDTSLGELYGVGGSLGGTAHVSLTTMLLDKRIFGDQAHPLILAEKNTSSGVNFATVYQSLLSGDMEENRIAITGVRRIKASRVQSGGDGIDPLVLLYLLKNSNDSSILRRMVTKQIENSFPTSETSVREREIILGDQSQKNINKVALLKEVMEVDGSILLSMGVDQRNVGKVLLFLAEKMISGELSSRDQINNFIKQI